MHTLTQSKGEEGQHPKIVYRFSASHFLNTKALAFYPERCARLSSAWVALGLAEQSTGHKALALQAAGMGMVLVM